MMSDTMHDSIEELTRRNFLRFGSMTAVALSLPAMQAETPHATMMDVPFTAAVPKIGIIGTGGRGTSLLENLLAADIQVLALCDVVREKAEHAQAMVTKAGQKSPELYTNGDHAFEALVARDDLNLVIIATPWNWHVEMAVAAMKHGKHAAVEVPAATSIEDCWKLVDTSEETRRHCIMLENCCYGYNETLILRMVHTRACSATCSTGKARICTTCARSSSPTRARACGAAISTPSATAISIPPTAWAQWPTIWESSAATDSTTSSP